MAAIARSIVSHHNAGHHHTVRSTNESERTLPPKISRVGAAADSVVVVVAVAGAVAAAAVESAVVVAVAVVVVSESVGGGVGATMVGASAEAVGVTEPASLGLMANRSSSGAMAPLPSVVAKGSSEWEGSGGYRWFEWGRGGSGGA